MTELKPCPFCGGKALLGFSKDEHLNERHFVICENVIKCGCLTQYCNSKDKAIEKWNRRADKDRYIKLPCKVGDTLYVISQMKDKRILPFVNKYEVTFIQVGKRKCKVYHEKDGFIKIFKQDDFGKTVFLSEEQANKKIKGVKQK